MSVGWRQLSTESAGVGEKRLWLTGLTKSNVVDEPNNVNSKPSCHLGNRLVLLAYTESSFSSVISV